MVTVGGVAMIRRVTAHRGPMVTGAMGRRKLFCIRMQKEKGPNPPNFRWRNGSGRGDKPYGTTRNFSALFHFSMI